MQIEKERFEAWLFSQPREQTFNYADNNDCQICRFFATTIGVKVTASSYDVKLGNAFINIPSWLRDLQDAFLFTYYRNGNMHPPMISFGLVQDCYTELFGPVPTGT